MIIFFGRMNDDDQMIGVINEVIYSISEILFDNIDHDIITVSFELESELDGVDGYCLQDDILEYTIELRANLQREELIRTIIHELVHIWQYARGDLVQKHIDGVGPRMIWKGCDMTLVEYTDRPWEQQAAKLEEYYYKKLRFS